MRERMVDILVTATGQHRERIAADIDRDYIVRGDAAIDYGVVDEIVTAREVMPIVPLAPTTGTNSHRPAERFAALATAWHDSPMGNRLRFVGGRHDPRRGTCRRGVGRRGCRMAGRGHLVRSGDLGRSHGTGGQRTARLDGLGRTRHRTDHSGSRRPADDRAAAASSIGSSPRRRTDRATGTPTPERRVSRAVLRPLHGTDTRTVLEFLPADHTGANPAATTFRTSNRSPQHRRPAGVHRCAPPDPVGWHARRRRCRGSRVCCPYAQLCNVMPAAPDDARGLLDEALHGRLLPGDGVAPLAELMRALPAACPLSLEMRSRRLMADFPDPTPGPSRCERRAGWIPAMAALALHGRVREAFRTPEHLATDVREGRPHRWVGTARRQLDIVLRTSMLR